MAEISWRDATDSKLADVDDVRLTAYNAANQAAWNVVAEMKRFQAIHDEKLGAPIQVVDIKMRTEAQGEDTETLDEVAIRAINALERVRQRMTVVSTAVNR